MHKRPVIVIVDDDPRALGLLLDALARRFGGDYRVVPHFSARAALEDLQRLIDEGEEIALVIADQWMPEMTGLELLGRVRDLARTAKRALLIAWGDHTSAPTILEGCAFGLLDNYLLKPWAPAEVHLYPQVGEFLAEWTRAYGPRMEIVRLIGDYPSRRTHELRELLDRKGIPYGFYAANTQQGQGLLDHLGLAGTSLPLLVHLDGRVLADPSNAQ